MERKNSYTRHVNSTTTAARVAEVQNKRESLLLAKTSKGLSCETDGMLRNFFREKAKANSFLQKVHVKNSGMLEPAKNNEQGQAIADDKFGVITGNGAREGMKVQRTRRISLDVNQTQETRKRIQEFITRDLPGQRTRPRSAGQKGQFNARKIGDEFEKNGSISQMTLSDSNVSPDDSKRNIRSATPVKVRSRTSGICYSHPHCHLVPLPSVHVPNIARKNSSQAAEFRRDSSYPSMRKGEFRRKLSTPIMVGQMSLEREKLYEVNFSQGSRDKTSKDEILVARRSSTPAPTKKYSI